MSQNIVPWKVQEVRFVACHELLTQSTVIFFSAADALLHFLITELMVFQHVNARCRMHVSHSPALHNGRQSAVLVCNCTEKNVPYFKHEVRYVVCD